MRFVWTCALFAASALAAPKESEWVGKRMPELTFLDPQGKKLSVPEVAEGKVLVLDVWAEWCNICRGWMPKMEALSSRYGKHGVKVVGVNADETDDRPKADAYLKKANLTFPMVFDAKNAISERLGIDSIPRVVVVDEDGIIRFLGHPNDLEGARLNTILLRRSPELFTRDWPIGSANFFLRRALQIPESEAENIEKALAKEPGNVLAHRLMGLHHLRAEQYEEAAVHLEKAFGAQPSGGSLEADVLSFAFVRRGTGLDDNSDQEIGFYRRALQLNPKNADALFALSIVYRGRTMPAEQKKALLDLLDLEPENAKGLRFLAELEVENKQPAEAKRRYQQLLKLEPSDIKTLLALSEISESEDKLKDSLAYQRQALRVLLQAAEQKR